MSSIDGARRGALLAAVALAAAIGASPAAAATHRKGVTLKVKSGTVTLVFDQTTLRSIDSGSSTVGTVTTAVAPASEPSAGTLVFPISHGSLSSLNAHGTLAATGGFTIESHLSVAGLFESSSSATAGDPAASLGRSSQLTMSSANFTPSTVAFFTLGLVRAKVTSSRHAVTIAKLPVSLTAAGVQLFGSSFKVGEQVATATILAKT